MARIRCKVEASPQDPEMVRVSMVNVDAKTTTHVDLDGSAVERLIELLAKARIRLRDPIPNTLDPNPRFPEVRVSTEPGARLFARKNNRPGSAEIPLALRHPGIGWLLYVFSPNRAASLGKALIERARQTEHPAAEH